MRPSKTQEVPVGCHVFQVVLTESSWNAWGIISSSQVADGDSGAKMTSVECPQFQCSQVFKEGRVCCGPTVSSPVLPEEFTHNLIAQLAGTFHKHFENQFPKS